MRKNAVGEAEIASMRKISTMHWDLTITTKCKHSTTRFTALRLATPVQEDYALVQDAINMLQDTRQ
jgi:hypothetical protein